MELRRLVAGYCIATQHSEAVTVMQEARALTHLDARNATTAEIMSAAFETAWSLMTSSRRRLSPKQACDARVRLARLILEKAEQGERDAMRLGRWAIASLKSGPSHPVGQYL
jgi:hypothetical protein